MSLPTKWIARRANPELALAVLLAVTVAVRAWKADQPIVENYVGRQVPTAMVARNLDRGSGVLRPQLDTGPFPNLFVVEPPVFAAAVVAVTRLTGLALEPGGRLVSAVGIALAGWGLFGLARRREGTAAALLAVAALAALPVTIRYGRAFQGDALMLGTLVAALRCWDDFAAGRPWPWVAAGWALLATGLALKVIAAYVLVPLVLVVLRPGRRAWLVTLALSALLPAVLWYVHAAGLLTSGGGSRAAADSGAIWLRALVPTAWLRAGTCAMLARPLTLRTFTPVGFGLAAWGLSGRMNGAVRCARPTRQDGRGGIGCIRDRLWAAWLASAGVALAILAGKLHHEYYLLALAPLVAVGIGRALAALWAGGRWGRCTAVGCGLGVAAWGMAQSASTWRTPPEWTTLLEAAAAIRAQVPEGVLVVAPEALLYYADRRGCRLEFGGRSAARAAGEWGGALVGADEDPALALIEFYRARGARFVADLGATAADPRRAPLHAAIRRRYAVRIDCPGVILAELTDPVPRSGEAAHGARRR